jgi:hypothetical protein
MRINMLVAQILRDPPALPREQKRLIRVDSASFSSLNQHP